MNFFIKGMHAPVLGMKWASSSRMTCGLRFINIV